MLELDSCLSSSLLTRRKVKLKFLNDKDCEPKFNFMGRKMKPILYDSKTNSPITPKSPPLDVCPDLRLFNSLESKIFSILSYTLKKTYDNLFNTSFPKENEAICSA
jgi:hypothetical protein